MVMKSKSTKRYYWHRKLKVLGIPYNAQLNTIFVPFTTKEEDLPTPVLTLRDEYGYNVQTEIT